jgi:hypothetical protein
MPDARRETHEDWLLWLKCKIRMLQAADYFYNPAETRMLERLRNNIARR